MEDRMELRPYISPVEQEAEDILRVFYTGERTKREWGITISELEKLDKRCMDIYTETRLIELYRRKYDHCFTRKNTNGEAYWRRKRLYTAVKMELYNEGVLMAMFDNLSWMWYQLDFYSAKYIGKVGYGYEVDNPIVTTGWEYPLLLNSLKPEKGELIYYLHVPCGEMCSCKQHLVDKYYVYVADDTIEHNLFVYIMYVDIQNGVTSKQCPEGFSFDATREKITCGCVDADFDKRPEKFRFLYVD